MAADDLLSILPVPALDDTELGVTPLPQAPQPPQMPQEGNNHRMANSIMLALAAVLGPNRGGGIPQGVLRGNQGREQTRRQEFQLQQQNFQREDQQYAIQQRQYEQQRDQRSRTFQQAVENLRKQVATMTDKAEYDAQMEAYANTLSAAGYRHIDANRLRIMVPFIGPKAETQAQDLIARWMKNPHNAQLLKDDPKRAAGAIIPFDRDGDGVPEQVTLADLATIARQPFAQGPDGTPMFSEPGTTQEMKANADGILQQLVAKAKAEGKDVTPELMITLQEEAIEKARRASVRADPPSPPKGPTPESETRKNMRIQAVNASFENSPIVKDYNVILGKAGSIKQILDAGLGGPGDLAVVYEFMKALDPNSVVRETEYATAAKSGNIFKGVAARFNGLFKPEGGFLSDQVKRDFLTLIQLKLQAQRTQYDNFRAEKGKQIDRVTNEPGTGASYLVDFGGAFPDLSGGQGATSGGEETWVRDPRTGKLVRGKP